jgi:hypothetical protein
MVSLSSSCAAYEASGENRACVRAPRAAAIRRVRVPADVDAELEREQQRHGEKGNAAHHVLAAARGHREHDGLLCAEECGQPRRVELVPEGRVRKAVLHRVVQPRNPLRAGTARSNRVSERDGAARRQAQRLRREERSPAGAAAAHLRPPRIKTAPSRLNSSRRLPGSGSVGAGPDALKPDGRQLRVLLRCSSSGVYCCPTSPSRADVAAVASASTPQQLGFLPIAALYYGSCSRAVESLYRCEIVRFCRLVFPMKDAIDLLLATALVWVETAVGARRPSVLACTLFAKVEYGVRRGEGVAVSGHHNRRFRIRTG